MVNAKAGCKVHVGNGRASRGHTIMCCNRSRGKIRFSLEWEPLTQTREEKEIIKTLTFWRTPGLIIECITGTETQGKNTSYRD